VCALQVGQEIEVRPGIVSKDTEGKLTCKPIFSRIMSLFAEQNDLNYAVPGGLIGMLQQTVLINVCNSSVLALLQNGTWCHFTVALISVPTDSGFC